MPKAGALMLTSPLEGIPGIGTRRALALAQLGLTNVGRLIAHLPMRHERQEAEATIDQLTPGQNIAARGEIAATRVIAKRPRPRFEAVLLDETGRIDLVWFNGLYLRDKLHPGMQIRVQGLAKRRGYGLQLVNPAWHAIAPGSDPPAREARLRPVYPASEAVPSRVIEEAIREVLPGVLPLLDDHLSAEYRTMRELPALAEAYRMYHKPESMEEVGAARRRLAYDELLLLQLGVHLRRAHLRERLRAPALRWSPEIDRRIRERFPFALTTAQDTVVKEIAADLGGTVPTNRLIQGDVGSGKTVVALYAMLMAVAAGHQAALMSPTEILAEQHHASITGMLAGSKVRVELLTGATPAAERESIVSRCGRGEVDILVGTHALLTETVRFASLAVAIIDEQHRFGVHQRATLRGKVEGGRGLTPHVLVMTATPIPRTLAITLFGDLDISTIAGLPPGRRPIKTRVVGFEKRAEVYEWLRGRVQKGEQAFVVAPAIGEREVEEEWGRPGEEEEAVAPSPLPSDAAAGHVVNVRGLMKELGTGPLKGLGLAVMHGRLKTATRERLMERFRAGQIDVLIATTVIEVGVDVPNATAMIVEQADRFGLAQLHQLRGRVGRGGKASACVLIASDGELTEEGMRRLKVVGETSDGFVLAERDFEIRGTGEIFGVRQSGMPPFRVADLTRDLDLLKMARRDAAAWVKESPGLTRPADGLLRRRLFKAHGTSLGLGDVG